jgi:hypothetical protein
MKEASSKRQKLFVERSVSSFVSIGVLVLVETSDSVMDSAAFDLPADE